MLVKAANSKASWKWTFLYKAIDNLGTFLCNQGGLLGPTYCTFSLNISIVIRWHSDHFIVKAGDLSKLGIKYCKINNTEVDAGRLSKLAGRPKTISLLVNYIPND